MTGAFVKHRNCSNLGRPPCALPLLDGCITRSIASHATRHFTDQMLSEHSRRADRLEDGHASIRERGSLSEVRGSCTACKGCLPSASPPARNSPSLVFVVAICSASPAPRP